MVKIILVCYRDVVQIRVVVRDYGLSWVTSYIFISGPVNPTNLTKHKRANMTLYRSPECQMFRVKWLFGSGVEVQIRFSRWRVWQPSWISDRNFFAVLLYKSLRYFPPCFHSTGLLVQEKKFKTDFQDGRRVI